MRQVIRVIREGAGCHAKELGIFLRGRRNSRFGEKSHKQIKIFQKKTLQHRAELERQGLRRTETIKSE